MGSKTSVAAALSTWTVLMCSVPTTFLIIVNCLIRKDSTVSLCGFLLKIDLLRSGRGICPAVQCKLMIRRIILGKSIIVQQQLVAKQCYMHNIGLSPKRIMTQAEAGRPFWTYIFRSCSVDFFAHTHTKKKIKCLSIWHLLINYLNDISAGAWNSGLQFEFQWYIYGPCLITVYTTL